MLCLSLDLTLLLLLWEISCTRYQRYHCLPLSLWLLQNNVVSSFPKPGNLFFWWSALRARRILWPRPPGLLRITTTNGQGCGGVWGHLDLTHRGASAMSCQAPHWFDLRCTATQWTDLSVLCYGERWNQEADSGAAAKRSHPAKFITLWEPDHVGIEEGWDLETLYWLSGTEQYHCLK